MTAQRDPDQILASWLDDGPTDLPAVTRRAILTALPTTPQARRGRFAASQLFSIESFAPVAMAALAIAIAAVGVLYVLGPRLGVGGPTPPPQSPRPAPTAVPSTVGQLMTPSPLDGSVAYGFPQPFSYHLPAGSGIVVNVSPLGFYQFRVPSGPDTYSHGIVVRAVSGGRTDPCSEISPSVPFGTGPQAVMDYLATVPTTTLADVGPVSLDGRPALLGTLRVGAATADCKDVWLWDGAGSITQNGGRPNEWRIWVVDVGSSHIAIYADAGSDWLRVAESFVQSLRFDASRPSLLPGG